MQPVAALQAHKCLTDCLPARVIDLVMQEGGLKPICKLPILAQ